MTRKTDEGSTAPLIAIVDDEDGMRVALVSLLHSAGYSTVEYPSAESFLAAPAARRARCLVLDLQLRGMGGLVLQQRVADWQPKISIIFISARATELQKAQALSAGAIAFLIKPFSDQVLLDAIAVGLG